MDRVGQNYMHGAAILTIRRHHHEAAGLHL